jgi:Xaa-Pro aminopeptidase
VDIRPLIAEMRLFKDSYELDCMQTAATISARGHIRAMQAAGAGVAEYVLEAELLYAFTQQGSRSPAYPSIVAGGANACVLHYVQNNALLRAGDLCLIDAGCEWQGYAADITRTFPVNGVFSGIQKTVYEIVLAAQLAAISAVRVGNSWNDPHLAALGVLAQGLIDLGVCQGSVDGVIESGAYQAYYMHRTGHWLGLDVHDVGAYKQEGMWRTLQDNMVLTVEPGLYFRAADSLPIALHGMGIRIEDDVLVRQNSPFILSHATPKTVAEIEEVMCVG